MKFHKLLLYFFFFITNIFAIKKFKEIFLIKNLKNKKLTRSLILKIFYKKDIKYIFKTLKNTFLENSETRKEKSLNLLNKYLNNNDEYSSENLKNLDKYLEKNLNKNLNDYLKIKKDKQLYLDINLYTNLYNYLKKKENKHLNQNLNQNLNKYLNKKRNKYLIKYLTKNLNENLNNLNDDLNEYLNKEKYKYFNNYLILHLNENLNNLNDDLNEYLKKKENKYLNQNLNQNLNKYLNKKKDIFLNKELSGYLDKETNKYLFFYDYKDIDKNDEKVIINNNFFEKINITEDDKNFIFNKYLLFLKNIKLHSFFSEKFNSEKNKYTVTKIKENFNLELINYENISKITNKNIVRLFNYLSLYNYNYFSDSPSPFYIIENELNNLLKDSENFLEKFHTDLFNLYLNENLKDSINFFYYSIQEYNKILNENIFLKKEIKSLSKNPISFIENYDIDGFFLKNESYEKLIKSYIQYKMPYFNNLNYEFIKNQINSFFNDIFYINKSYLHILDCINPQVLEYIKNPSDIMNQKTLKKLKTLPTPLNKENLENLEFISNNLIVKILENLNNINEILLLSILKKSIFFGTQETENLIQSLDKNIKKIINSHISHNKTLYLNTYESKYLKIKDINDKEKILFPKNGTIEIFKKKINDFKNPKKAESLINSLIELHEIEFKEFINLYSKLNYYKIINIEKIDEKFFINLNNFLKEK